MPQHYATRLTPHGSEESHAKYHFSTKLILDEAERFGVQWRTIPGTTIIELRLHDTVRHFWGQVPSTTSYVGYYGCTNKYANKCLLHDRGISVPRGYLVFPDDTAKDSKEVYDALRKPIVVKPVHGSTHGRDVHVGIDDLGEYECILSHLLPKAHCSSGILVEEMFRGEEYRILATRDQVLGVIHRIPANVVGDGRRTVRALVELKNADSRRGEGHTKALVNIAIDDEATALLSESSLEWDSVVERGRRVFLRKVSNLSQGGDSIDITDIVHPSVLEIALRAMNAIPDLALAGIDFMTNDIASLQTDDSYVIIEMNHSPMLSMHDYPYEGKNRHAAREFLFLLFPELRRQHGHHDAP